MRTDRVRLAALMYPKEGVSFEEFDSHWLNVHSRLFASLDIVKKNLLKYEQVRLTPLQGLRSYADSIASSPVPLLSPDQRNDRSARRGTSTVLRHSDLRGRVVREDHGGFHGPRVPAYHRA